MQGHLPFVLKARRSRCLGVSSICARAPSFWKVQPEVPFGLLWVAESPNAPLDW